MKFIAPLAVAAALLSAPVSAQEVSTVDPTTSFGAGGLSSTALLSIAAAVVTVGIIVASDDDDDDSSSGTN